MAFNDFSGNNGGNDGDKSKKSRRRVIIRPEMSSVRNVKRNVTRQHAEDSFREVQRSRKEKTELPDLLVALSGEAAGCETTLTFDRKAARSSLFEML